MIIEVLTPEKVRQINSLAQPMNKIKPEYEQLLSNATQALENNPFLVPFEHPIKQLTTFFKILSRNTDVSKEDLKSDIWREDNYADLALSLLDLFGKEIAESLLAQRSKLMALPPNILPTEPAPSLRAIKDGHEELSPDEKTMIKNGREYLCSLCVHYHLITIASSDKVRKRCLISDEKPIAQYCNQFERAGKHDDELDDR
jgi:hypothetical protein